MSAVTVVPNVEIEIGGRLLDKEEARRVAGIRVCQRLSQPTLAEITLFGQSGAPAGLTAAGSEVSFRIRITGHRQPLFAGRITAVEFDYAPSCQETIRVRGYDDMYLLRKRQRIRSHAHVSCIDMMREAAGELSLSFDCAEHAPVWPWVIQHHQSDLDFLGVMTQRAGLYFFLDDATIRLFSLKGWGEPVSATRGKDLLEAKIELNGDQSWSEVQTSGWNPFTVQEIRSGANTPRSARTVRAGVRDGFAGNAGVRRMVNRPLYDDKHAESISQALLDKSSAGEITLTGVAEGNPLLRPGIALEARGVAAPVEGRYVVTEATHTIDPEHGYLTRIDTRPPGMRDQAHEPVALLGEVTSVQDPEKLGRVKVSLSGCENIETDWLSVMTIAGGKDKGIIAQPDVGDGVVVLSTDNEPGFGVVLGGLYGEKRSPPSWGIQNGAVKQFLFATPGKQTVLLDDAGKRVRLENAEGSFCELRPGKVVIHAEADFDIEAPGKTIVIRAQRIDFKNG